MKKIILFLALLFAFNILNAQVWTINSCSTSGSTAYGPMYSVSSANATNRTAVIYPSSQLSALAGKLLTNMYFKRNTTTGSLAGTPNFKIYLKEVSSIDWGAGNLTWANAVSGATLVYDSNPVVNVGTNDGWKSFPLTGSFTYSVTQNLAVITEYNNTTLGIGGILWEAENVAPCVDTANSNVSKYTNLDMN